jgi:hypothetical protein
MLNDKWAKYFNKPVKKKQGKFAEKILIGYEHMPRVSLKHCVLYREVDSLDNNALYVTAPYRDSEGFTVGIRTQRIYPTMKTMKEVVEQFIKEGWILETESCHEEALAILRGDIEDV